MPRMILALTRNNPEVPGYYWLYVTHWDYKTQTHVPKWEIANWDGEDWWVFGREYGEPTYSHTKYFGPLEEPK